MLQLTTLPHTAPPTWQLAGELNIQHAAQARELLLAALQGWKGPALCMDLAAVTEADTAGLQLLLALERSLLEQGSALQLLHCPPVLAHVGRTFGMAWGAPAQGAA